MEEYSSDGVIAVIITIMVFGLKVPHEADMAALLPLPPAFLIYVLSFIFLASSGTTIIICSW